MSKNNKIIQFNLDYSMPQKKKTLYYSLGASLASLHQMDPLVLTTNISFFHQ